MNVTIKTPVLFRRCLEKMNQPITPLTSHVMSRHNSLVGTEDRRDGASNQKANHKKPNNRFPMMIA